MIHTCFRWLWLPLFLLALFLRLGLGASPAALAHQYLPQAQTSSPDTGTLIGLITHAETGARLSGVVVSTSGQVVQTGSNGVYLFTNLPPGQRAVLAEHPDFYPATQSGLVIANQTRWNSIALRPRPQPTPPATPSPLPLPTETAPAPPPSPTATPAPQTGTLIGLITDAETGQRLAGVTVSVAGQTMVTGERGVYRFEVVPAGAQVVRAEKDGYQPGLKMRAVIPGQVRWNSIKLSQSFSNCPVHSEAVFDLVPIRQAALDARPDYRHGDLNLALRGYSPAKAALTLQNYDGNADPNAPQLAGLFKPNSFPGIRAVYRVNHWDWSCGEHGCRGSIITDWPVTMIGLAVTAGQAIYLPERAPQIYAGDYRAVVLYAEETRLTLGYTRDDSVAPGYAVHLENVCVDPNLLALYRAQNDEAGFRLTGLLPALRNNQKLGIAFGSEIQVAIRDRGAFMDPRSRKDWWVGY